VDVDKVQLRILSRYRLQELTCRKPKYWGVGVFFLDMSENRGEKGGIEEKGSKGANTIARNVWVVREGMWICPKSKN